MKKAVLLFALFLILSTAFAAENPLVFKPQRAAQISNIDSTNSHSIQFDVSIFGEGAVGSMYILWDDIDLSAEVKELLTKHEFRNNEYYMQNIDREQFEQERMLQLFEDKKREYFRIFPSEIQKAKEDEENE
ncbi:MULTISPECIES: hypothetical protein [Fibrobacter]|uniref:Uncharacterized protein n=1 Tax=Fibrobacter intestinalis TaxID=28122 RepID=A0A1M6YW02_9BACT|nr:MULTISPECIES: hypothetical protein [Fibrobacter]MDD7298053.1 hypothetical protein [Fibrobacter intestinalis]PBC66744.1 hypothetical protein BGX14_2375 [Fibrobacter sp. UWS1]PBC75141.1 hypothetical protein BGW94_2824 [Fibrobacter sp. NR9]SHL22481.1 hypothetical protein SAMN05720469_1497 [Fibrobacter intestinalis]SJZ71928.1 hypothetical protein SAMN02745108_01423 [Fibrobacter intestinalis]